MTVKLLHCLIVQSGVIGLIIGFTQIILVKYVTNTPGLGKTEIFSVPDRNLEIGTDWKQPKVPKNRSHTGPILRNFSPILSDI